VMSTRPCSFCKDNAVYTREYEGVSFCGKCFRDAIEEKVRRTILRHEMLTYNDHIAVAVSGGKDSLTLLNILSKLEHRYPRSRITAISVDEGIEGYRDEALHLAAKDCKRLGLEHVVVSYRDLFGTTTDEIAKTGLGKTPCSYCGVFRRKAINKAATRIGATKIATAHNLDDETQTILLNLLHGDALRIARVKPVLDERHPKLIQRVKPLCEVPEKEIAFYAFQNRIKFQSIPCPYASTALRNDIRLILNRIEEKHPGTKFTFFKSVEKIKPALEKMADETKLRECKFCGEPTVGDVCKTCQILQALDVV